MEYVIYCLDSLLPEADHQLSCLTLPMAAFLGSRYQWAVASFCVVDTIGLIFHTCDLTIFVI